MESAHTYMFPAERRAALESLPLPLAVYQYVDGRVVTLLVSDGLCELTGRSRASLIDHYDREMFGNVHPDDRPYLACLGYRFATEGGGIRSHVPRPAFRHRRLSAAS